MKKIASVLCTCLLAFCALLLSGCSADNNSAIVGDWEPGTVSIRGTTISYSELETKGNGFSLKFFSDGKCKIVIGGVSNEGTYTFNETSVDVQYAGKSQKLSYDHGMLTLKLTYNDQTMLLMFNKVIK